MVIFYAHNIMIDQDSNTILGDFGGLHIMKRNNLETSRILEREVRAFGCLIELVIKFINI